MSETVVKVFRSIYDKLRVKWIDYLTAALEIILSAFIGFLVAALILFVLGYDPWTVFSVMIRYGYSDWSYLAGKSIPLIMTGLAFSIPLLAGVFNIGGESQLYWGAMLGLIVAYYTHSWVLAVLVGILGGALWGGLIAFLRVRRGINEVITAIMLNWITYYLVIFMILEYFLSPIRPYESVKVPVAARLDVTEGLILAVIGVAIVYYLLYYTSIGYKMRVSGLSPQSARYAGFNPSTSMLWSMIIGGGMAGYGGALLILAVSYSIDTTMSTLYGLGFTGIGVGLLGRNHPVGIIFSALFIAGLIIGGQWVELKTGAPPMLSDAITGTIVIALAAPYAYRMLINYVRRLRQR